MNSAQQQECVALLTEALAKSGLSFERGEAVGGNVRWQPLTGKQWYDLGCSMLGAALKRGIRITVGREE